MQVLQCNILGALQITIFLLNDTNIILLYVCFIFGLFLGTVPVTPASHTKCYPKYELKYRKKCQTVNDKVCYTKYEEKCTDEDFQSCRAIKTKRHDRECITRPEMLCSLKERSVFVDQPVDKYVEHCDRVKGICSTVPNAV